MAGSRNNFGFRKVRAVAQNTVVFKTQAMGPSELILGTVITRPEDVVESFIAGLPDDIHEQLQCAAIRGEFRIERPNDGLNLVSPLARASWEQVTHLAVDTALPVDHTRFVITPAKK